VFITGLSGLFNAPCELEMIPGFPAFYLETYGTWNVMQCAPGMEFVQVVCDCLPKVQGKHYSFCVVKMIST